MVTDRTVPHGLWALEDCILFRPLDAEERRNLMAHAHRRSFAPGEHIFHIGAPGHSLMAVLSGSVRISVPSPEGKEITLAVLEPGAVFGEIAVLDGKERTADAAAITTCELVILERRDVLAFLERQPKVSLKLLEVLCARLRRADEQIAEIAFLELPTRLAKTIWRLADNPAAWRPGAPPLKLPLTQRELGNLIGGTRESVNRCLREWQRRGIIRIEDGVIAVLDPPALEELAELASNA